MDYWDLSKASPKDDFPLSDIHIILSNTARHKMGYFIDYFARKHQIWIVEEDKK